MQSIKKTWASFAKSGLLLLVGVASGACAHGGASAPPAEHGEPGAAAPAHAEPSSPASSDYAPAGVVVVSRQDACPVVLPRNGTLELHLGGNPSTGYSWQITNGATSVLTSRGEPTQSEGSGVPGSPAEYVYRFDASSVGRGHLALAYGRAWEASAPPAATFECDITVSN